MNEQSISTNWSMACPIENRSSGGHGCRNCEGARIPADDRFDDAARGHRPTDRCSPQIDESEKRPVLELGALAQQRMQEFRGLVKGKFASKSTDNSRAWDNSAASSFPDAPAAAAEQRALLQPPGESGNGTAAEAFARNAANAHARRMGDLAGQIAHDYANLLMVISEQVSLVREDLPQHHPGVAALRMVEVAAERARNLTHSLRAVVKGIDLQMAPLNLSKLVTDWLRTVRRGLPESIDIVADMQIDPAVVILGDAAQLRRVLTNVAANANDAMSTGGRLTLSLRERSVRSNGGSRMGPHARTEAVISVTDSGRGMTAEALSKVFDPFYTTKPNGEGAGLGMAIVREVIAAHQGRIALESAPGRGTTVSVAIPCQSGNRSWNDARIGRRTRDDAGADRVSAETAPIDPIAARDYPKD